MIPSIFNDVIGPVMRGPSSSHCAAALRIGRLARDLAGGDLRDVLVEFDRQGSLPTTHDTQGSDMGLCGGLLGWEATDDRLPDSMQILLDSGIRLAMETVDAGDPHPNTYRLTVRGHGNPHTLHAISTGGGIMEVIRIDGIDLSIHGDYHETLLWTEGDGESLRAAVAALYPEWQVFVHRGKSTTIVEIKGDTFASEDDIAGLEGITEVQRLGPVLPVASRPDMTVPFTSCNGLLAHAEGKGWPLWKWAVAYETARGGLTEEEVMEKMRDIVRILRRSIAQGIAGTEYEDRVLGHQSGRFDQLLREGKLLEAGAMNRIVLYVTALMEVKSSMGLIVAAPTAGACAALPGAVIAMAECMGLEEDAMARGLLAAGLIGIFIATPWTFAAEVGGCQAEGGSAAAMAAAALVTLADGPLEHAVAASSMAMQSMIGLICDPIANRVEAPCLGKNVMAATNALACANMAMAGFDPVIPFDEVVWTAKNVSTQMPRELRCTALGGLSITPTSLAIEAKLAAGRQAKACGAGCGCG